MVDETSATRTALAIRSLDDVVVALGMAVPEMEAGMSLLAAVHKRLMKL